MAQRIAATPAYSHPTPKTLVISVMCIEGEPLRTGKQRGENREFRGTEQGIWIMRSGNAHLQIALVDRHLVSL
jgi:hypothetical protein